MAETYLCQLVLTLERLQQMLKGLLMASWFFQWLKSGTKYSRIRLARIVANICVKWLPIANGFERHKRDWKQDTAWRSDFFLSRTV
jgi:hypothetical protein